MKIIVNSEAETLKLGKKLAKDLRGGEVITLSGDLGAGKTIFTKGLAQGLGVKKIITSPTFILMNVYPVKKEDIKQLTHIDCYRIEDENEITEVGATEYFNDPDTVTVIEWPEKIKGLLPKKRIHINIKIKASDKREIIMQK